MKALSKLPSKRYDLIFSAGAEDWAVDLSRLRPIFAGMKLRHPLMWHVYRIVKRMCRR